MQDRFCLWKVLTSLLALGCLVQLLSIDHEPSQGALYLLLVIVGLPHREKSKSSCKSSNYMTLSQSFFMKAVTSWEYSPCIFLWNKLAKATRTKEMNLNSIFVPRRFLFSFLPLSIAIDFDKKDQILYASHWRKRFALIYLCRFPLHYDRSSMNTREWLENLNENTKCLHYKCSEKHAYLTKTRKLYLQSHQHSLFCNNISCWFTAIVLLQQIYLETSIQ